MQLALKSSPPKFSSEELLGHEKYDAMLLAIAKCQEVDELVDVHDKMKALELYAKEARNYESELRAWVFAFGSVDAPGS